MPVPATSSVIDTARLRIRPFRPGDADDLHAYLSLAEVYRFEPGEPVDRAGAQRLAEERSTGLRPRLCTPSSTPRRLERDPTRYGLDRAYGTLYSMVSVGY